MPISWANLLSVSRCTSLLRVLVRNPSRLPGKCWYTMSPTTASRTASPRTPGARCLRACPWRCGGTDALVHQRHLVITDVVGIKNLGFRTKKNKALYPCGKRALLSIKLFSILLEYYTAVVTTESESIAQCCTNLTLLSFVECEVQVVIELWIVVTLFMVDRRRNDVVLHTKNTGHSLYCTSCTEEVTSH